MGLDEIKTSMDKVIYEMAMAVSMMHSSRDSFSSDSNKLYHPGASTGLQDMNPQYSEPEVALGRGSLTPMATQELGSSQQCSRRPDMKGPKPSDTSNILSICKSLKQISNIAEGLTSEPVETHLNSKGEKLNAMLNIVLVETKEVCGGAFDEEKPVDMVESVMMAS
jgi:hypothetical protein